MNNLRTHSHRVIIGKQPKPLNFDIQRVPFEPVCTENLNPDIMVMKSAKDR